MRIILKSDNSNPGRCIPISFLYSDTDEGVPLSAFTNADAKRADGLYIWDFVRMHLDISPSWVIDNNDGTYTFDIRIDDIKIVRIKVLKEQTYNYIATQMPDWRIMRWIEYCRFFDKIQSGNILSLWEQKSYDNFPDPNETYTEAYLAALKALGWINDCIAEHTHIEIAIWYAVDINGIKQALESVNYPVWPL